MSVRQSLLAILDQGPCYGYQLRAEFERRTGGGWPLNVGQVYNTLDRLERDGLVSKGGSDDQGHVFYRITDAGRREVHDWLASAVVHAAHAVRDELIVKLALGATLPEADLEAMLTAQHEVASAALARATAALHDLSDPVDAISWAKQLTLQAEQSRARAELSWLETVERSWLAAPEDVRQGAALDDAPVRRGRPARAEALDSTLG